MTQHVIQKLEELSEVLQRFERDALFIVADLDAYEASGAKHRLTPLLRDYTVELFGVTEPNPKIEHVQAGVTLLRRFPQALVLAIGGGTAIDTAKSICYCAAQPSGKLDLENADLLRLFGRVLPRTVPLVAVPTTAGTGSEATHFAVLYVDGIKHSIAHPSLTPDAVVLDATLTASLPPSVTASSGLDAVAQAIESLWSVYANDDSIAAAEKALHLGLKHIEAAVHRPTLVDREAMLQAANLAGLAINVSRTTAPHALSYSLTSRHGIPHGIAVAICLAPFLRFNGLATRSDVAHPGGIDSLRASIARIAAAFEVSPGAPYVMDQVAWRWKQLLDRLDCPTRLSECGIRYAEELEWIVRSINQQRLRNNPRVVSESDLQQIVHEMA